MSQPGATPQEHGMQDHLALKGRNEADIIAPLQGVFTGGALITQGVALGWRITPRWG